MRITTFQRIAISCLCVGLLYVYSAKSQDTSRVDHSDSEDVFWSNRPESSHYFFGPTAYGPLPGEGSYQNGMILLNRLEVGITNNVSASAGVFPVVFWGEFGMPTWIMPKVSVPIVRDKLNIAGGVMAATIVGVDEGDPSEGLLGVAYGVATYGSRDNNLSFGAGYGYSDGGFNTSPLLMASGTARLSKRFALISENYFKVVSENNSLLLSAGGRLYGKRIAFDFALLSPIDLERNVVTFIPWLSLNVPFYFVHRRSKSL